MVRSIINNSNEIFPVCAWLEGQYGINDVYCGVPVSLGKNGVQKIHEIELRPESLDSLKNSANEVKKLCESVYQSV